MPRRPAALAAACALALAAPAGAAEPAPSWAAAEIRVLVERGLAAGVEDFRPDDPLTRGALADLLGGLTGVPEAPPAQPEAPVTMAGLDARLVGALGLADAAWRFRAAARDAGVATPARFGSEVVARLLGLRLNHPAARDALERRPNEPVTRAEAAFSAARVLRLDARQVETARGAAVAFALPELTAWQRKVLLRAFSLVGYPYVWGGEDERTERGFDCSGFVWRVYRTRPFAGGAALAGTLRGRTTQALSGEVPRARRIGFADLRPGDIAFFGAKGPASKPAQVDHAGIVVGPGWLVHSSRYGVTLVPLEGWYRERFAWARRPLAEAGLEGSEVPA